MKYKFTLKNAIAGNLVTREPLGWKEIIQELDRDNEFHSVVELFESPLTFMAKGGNIDGGMDYILNILKSQGPNALIEFIADIDENDNGIYDLCFEGKLDLIKKQELSAGKRYKLEIPIIPNDFHSKFISRYETDIDLESTNTEDQTPATPVSPIAVHLTPQLLDLGFKDVMKSSFIMVHNGNPTDYHNIEEGNYVQVGFAENVSLDEIETRYSVGFNIGETIPFNIFNVKYAGELLFTGRITMSAFTFRSVFDPGLPQYGFHNISANFKWYVQVNDQVPIEFTHDYETITAIYFAPIGLNYYTPPASVTVQAGDEVRIYGRSIVNVDPGYQTEVNQLYIIGDTPSDPNGGGPYLIAEGAIGEKGAGLTFMEITQKSVYPETTVEGFYIHDAAGIIADRITGEENAFHSDATGGTNTQYKQYEEDGCAKPFFTCKGSHIRGWTLLQKRNAMSMQSLYDGIDPVFGLGLGVEKVNGKNRIRLEKRDFFFRNEPSGLVLSKVNDIRTTFLESVFYSRVNIGYNKWESQASGGIDDIQTKHQYALMFASSGKPVDIYSKMIAASYGWETMRRKRKEQSADDSRDVNDFLLHILSTPGDFSPPIPTYEPKVGVDGYTGISGLKNPETRYNLDLSVKRNLMRQADYLSAALFYYPGQKFYFKSGEGNYDAIVTSPEPICGGAATANEKADLEASKAPMFLPEIATFRHPLSWSEYKIARDKRHQTILVSTSTRSYVPYFILNIKHQRASGMADFKLLRAPII